MAQTTKIHDGKTKPIIVTDTAYPGGHFLGTVGTGGGGGGGAVTAVAGAFVDGSDVTQGTTTDAGVVTDTSGTAIGFARGNIIQWISQLSRMGSLTETAPATDTASSGLNGRLQRIAQRLTTLLPQNSGRLNVDGAGGTFPVTNANLDAATSTLLTISDFDTKTGSLTETAPATDTASSGVNGRLQRVAQRLSSLIALLPTALGTTTAANSLPVTLASDSTYATLQGGVTETAPATDTASSGANGRLQRIAQRITSLIALLPPALISNRLDVNLGAAPATVTVQGGAAAGAAVAGNPVLMGVSDGTNAQAVKQGQLTSGAITATGVLPVQMLLTRTTADFRAVQTADQLGSDAQSGSGFSGTGILISNGTSWDRQRNNVDATLLASGARTTTQGPTTLTTYNLGAIIFVLDVTSAGTGSVTLTINEVDPASGKSILLLSGAAVTTNSTNVYIIDPMLTAAANSIAKNRITRTLSWTLTANNANTLTASLGTMQLVP